MLSLLFDMGLFAGGFWAGHYFSGDVRAMIAAVRKQWDEHFGPKP